ncbi:hypothetical protein SAMN05421748_106181 [Paractinoplanes atraurantiacus]|uniref:Uncharacterized protein n=1 Tax=Paractinoplanes atraurantiacus TaxID=1036182 RepID=A0A285I0T9_9ACTN|nr:hypothetical protein SAMN05421748_106181 [Actinoplanes atraurantiacus]
MRYQQLGFFSRKQMSAMTDRTLSPKWSPEHDADRRELDRCRKWGLAQRHGFKLFRLRIEERDRQASQRTELRTTAQREPLPAAREETQGKAAQVTASSEVQGSTPREVREPATSAVQGSTTRKPASSEVRVSAPIAVRGLAPRVARAIAVMVWGFKAARGYGDSAGRLRLGAHEGPCDEVAVRHLVLQPISRMESVRTGCGAMPEIRPRARDFGEFRQWNPPAECRGVRAVTRASVKFGIRERKWVARKGSTYVRLRGSRPVLTRAGPVGPRRSVAGVAPALPIRGPLLKSRRRRLPERKAPTP